LSNEQLMALVASGDASAENALFDRYASLVHGLVWKILGPDPDAADVVHDVFIRIYRGLRSVRDPERLSDWVVRVTTNTVTNELRKRRLRRFIPWDSSRDTEHPLDLPDLEGRELLRRTYAALEQLPPMDRVVLALRLFESGSIDEIARSCGCSTRTAKRRLQQARNRFESIASRDPLLAARIAQGAKERSQERTTTGDR
jgi:RNA polymerase sigma-70 factor (ECF subfamily)